MPLEKDREQYRTPEIEALVSSQDDTRALLEELRNKLAPVSLACTSEDSMDKDQIDPAEERCELRHTIRLAVDRQKS